MPRFCFVGGRPTRVPAIKCAFYTLYRIAGRPLRTLPKLMYALRHSQPSAQDFCDNLFNVRYRSQPSAQDPSAQNPDAQDFAVTYVMHCTTVSRPLRTLR